MSALEPRLTKADLTVLRAVPPASRRPEDIWELGKQLDTFDLIDLERTLNGLRHLGYITRLGRKWARLTKGDEAVA